MQLKKSIKFKKTGFTLIETIVAIGTISIVLPLVFAIFFVILQEQARFTALKQVKSEGENALYQIKNTIKTRAVKACADKTCSKECTDETTNPYFKDEDGKIFRFFIDESTPRIASGTDTIPIRGYLTTQKVKIEPVSDYLTRCEIQGNQPIIDINFKISFNTTSGEDRYASPMIYKTKVRLKSY